MKALSGSFLLFLNKQHSGVSQVFVMQSTVTGWTTLASYSPQLSIYEDVNRKPTHSSHPPVAWKPVAPA